MSGELKHGPLALVDDTMPMIMIVHRDPTYIVMNLTQITLQTFFPLSIFFQKCMNSLQQVVAREGRPILIGGEDDTETASYSSSYIGVPQTVDCLQGEHNIFKCHLISL